MKKLLTACLLTTALCGAETLFETNGENNDDFISATATQANLTGDTPQLVFRVFNNVGEEEIRFNDVIVSSGALANSAPVLTPVRWAWLLRPLGSTP